MNKDIRCYIHAVADMFRSSSCVHMYIRVSAWVFVLRTRVYSCVCLGLRPAYTCTSASVYRAHLSVGMRYIIIYYQPHASIKVTKKSDFLGHSLTYLCNSSQNANVFTHIIYLYLHTSYIYMHPSRLLLRHHHWHTLYLFLWYP